MLESRPSSPRPNDPEDQRDLELLERINSRDKEAFRSLYTRYYHSLQRFIFGITGSLDASQEGINDVMLVIWTNGRSFGGRSRVRTWIMGIAYRKALKLAHQARQWRERFKSAEVGDWNELSDPSSEPSKSAEIADWLEFALRELPVKQRAVVELTYRYGYSYEEIAEIVECPVNTVKTRMFHARAALRRVVPEAFGD